VYLVEYPLTVTVTTRSGRVPSCAVMPFTSITCACSRRGRRVVGGQWRVATASAAVVVWRNASSVAGDEDRLCAAPAVDVAPTVAQAGSGGY